MCVKNYGLRYETTEIQSGRIVLEKSCGRKSENIFHALYYHNQMDNVCAGKHWAL